MEKSTVRPKTHVVPATRRTCHATTSLPRTEYYGITWSNHPGWQRPQMFNCLGRIEPREVRVVECLHTFTDSGVFEQLAYFEDGDYFKTAGRYRIDSENPLDYWIQHDTAETRFLEPFKTGLPEQKLQYISIDPHQRTVTTARRDPSARLTLWSLRDPGFCQNLIQ